MSDKLLIHFKDLVPGDVLVNSGVPRVVLCHPIHDPKFVCWDVLVLGWDGAIWYYADTSPLSLVSVLR